MSRPCPGEDVATPLTSKASDLPLDRAQGCVNYGEGPALEIVLAAQQGELHGRAAEGDAVVDLETRPQET